jgi:hypothetical protein
VEPNHLSPEQVQRILEIVQDAGPILIGGQALNIWVRHYRLLGPEFFDDAPFTSKDIDFFRNEEAARLLQSHLVESKLLIPKAEDATPNAAKVVGTLGDREVEVDFMNNVLGTDERSVEENCVTLNIRHAASGDQIQVTLLHPLDVLRSRLANVNTLRRTDDHSLRQAKAAVEVIHHFADELLRLSADKMAQELLHDLAYVIRDHCMRHDAFRQHGIDALPVMHSFMDDTRLDDRWRSLSLTPAIERLEAARRAMAPAQVPDYPAETHTHKVSADGGTVVVRELDRAIGKLGKVDNPIGPAYVGPDGVRYALGGVFLSEADWQARMDANDAPRPPEPGQS